MQRQTITRSISLEGVGVHSGVVSRVTLSPFEDGVALSRVDGHRRIFTLTPSAIKPSPMCTILDNGQGGMVSTVEHLLSALHGMGVTDIEIEVDGPEVPILDGSALPWVNALEDAGLLAIDDEAAVLAVGETVRLEDGGRVLAASPSSQLSIDCRIDFAHPRIGAQRWQGVITPEVYKAEIAPARSFILESELAQAQAAGFVKGAALAGGILFLNDGTVANPEGLRFADEPVRHKVMDAIGDLFLAGKPVVGAFELARPGHTSNNALLRRIEATCTKATPGAQL